MQGEKGRVKGDEVCKVKRAVERRGRGWGGLPRKLQEEMDSVRKLYELAGAQGHAMAMYRLAFNHKHGLGVEADSVKAEDYYRRAIEINPNHAKVHFDLGNVLKRKGNLDGAEEHYRRCIAINLNYAKAHFNPWSPT